MHVCQELWSGNSGPCAGYLLIIINDYLSLSFPQRRWWDKGLGAGSLFGKWILKPQMTQCRRWDREGEEENVGYHWSLLLPSTLQKTVVCLSTLPWNVGAWAVIHPLSPLFTVAPRGARAKPQAENKCNTNTWVRSWQNVIKGLSQVHRSAPMAWSRCFLSAFLLISISCFKAESQEKRMHNA